MKDFFEKLIARKRKEIEDLKKRAKDSQDVAEVRAIGETLEALRNEIAEAEAALAEAEANEGAGEASRSGVPAGAELRNGQVKGVYGMNTTTNQRAAEADPYDTVEYRNAFMEHVCRNVPIPAEYRADAATATGDVGAVIPTTILKEIIQKLESFGNVYAMVRKLNIQGGVAIPISDLKPVANWIGEDSASEDQKLTANNSITFSYYGIECKIAQTLLANVVTLDAFQQLFVPLATEAIVKGIEIAIFTGDGVNKPLGVINDTRVPEGNVITMSPEEFANWSAWHKKVKAKMKRAYRKGTFFMSQASFDGYIDGMVDEKGQPVGRTNYGIDGEETYRFMGKNVETVEDECIAAFDDAAEGDVVGVFMKPTDYGINSNMQLVVVKWTDHDNNKLKNKAIMIVDGKLIDANGVLIIKKGASTPSV